MSQVNLISLADLLRERGLSAGSLATEIEKGGIWGEDRYGRLTRFTDKSDEGKRVLDRLAWYYRASVTPQQDDGPTDAAPFEDPLHLFGWRESQLPPFEEPEQVASRPKRPQADARVENNDRRMIDLFRRLCYGELTGNPHPDAHDIESLCAVFEDHAAGREGFKPATVKLKLDKYHEAWE